MLSSIACRERVERKIWAVLVSPLALIILSGGSISNLALDLQNPVQALLLSSAIFNANVVSTGLVVGYVIQRLSQQQKLNKPYRNTRIPNPNQSAEPKAAISQLAVRSNFVLSPLLFPARRPRTRSLLTHLLSSFIFTSRTRRFLAYLLTFCVFTHVLSPYPCKLHNFCFKQS